MSRKRLCEELLKLSISEIVKRKLINGHGIIDVYRFNQPSVGLNVTGNGCTLSMNYKKIGISQSQTIDLDKTPCNYGKYRYWFKCPSCKQRSSILYGDPTFACRTCQDLHYYVQHKNPEQKSMLALKRIRKKLGATMSIDDPIGPRPKYMHQKTFDHLLAQYDAIECDLYMNYCRPSVWAQLPKDMRNL